MRINRLWIYPASVALALGALFVLTPVRYTNTPSAIVPGGPAQTISLVGTKQPTTNIVFPLVAPRHNVVHIIAGDRDINKQNLRRVAQVIQQVSSRTLNRTIGMLPTSSTVVVLYSTPATYRMAAKAAFPASQIDIVVEQTGGFTSGRKVYIPLYKYHDNAFLANTLTHELTHATFNEIGIGPKLPTWLNEGVAWYDGTQAERSVNPTAVQQLNADLRSQLRQAQNSGELQPIAASAGNVLRKNPPYNTEFQDYLAVRYLVQTYGNAKLQQFLTNLRTSPLDHSFQKAYPMSLESFSRAFTGVNALNYSVQMD